MPTDRAPADRQTFAAEVTAEGVLRFAEPMRWRTRLAALRGKKLTVTVEREVKRRGDPANRYYWAAVARAVAEYLSIGRELPLSKDDAHRVLCSAFIGTEDTPLGPTPCRSSTLTSEQFSTFIERIKAHAASEWGLRIPGPDEAWADEEIA
jgi:hypothetical protein